MKMSEEKSYEVNDRRKVKLDENGEVVSETDTADADTVAEEVKDTNETIDYSDLPPVDIVSLIKTFIGILAQQTWQWLGLFKNPSTDKLETDLPQARTAIDTISVLAAKLEGKITQSEQQELQAMLSDLQMNFVKQSSKEQSEK
jgi:hypothetical protein